jgi:hypothetical protein
MIHYGYSVPRSDGWKKRVYEEPLKYPAVGVLEMLIIKK